MKNSALFTKIAEFFDDKKPQKTIAVAVSGGSDSLALTLILQQFCKQKNIKLFALTVDHKMRKSSTKEARELGKILKNFQIEHQILTADFKAKPLSDIENKMRQKRYELLYEFCQTNKINSLFLGHQQDDLAENFLIRLFRGSGIDGLSAIEEISYYKNLRLLRPFLNFSKKDLQEYLQKLEIQWFEDESNDDEKFLRNKIRKFLNDLPDKDSVKQRIAATTKQISQSKKIIDDIIITTAKEILEFNNLGYFLLKREKFLQLDENLALKILAYILIEISDAIYKPRLEKLQNFYQNLKIDKLGKAKTFYGCVIEKFDEERLIIYRERKAINLKNISYFDEKNIIIDNRFIIPKSQNLFLLDAKSFNLLAKENKKLQKIKNPLKKVFYTIPLNKDRFKLHELDNYQFHFRTILKNSVNL